MTEIVIQYLIAPILTALIGFLIGQLKDRDSRAKARDKADVVLLRKMLKDYYDMYKDVSLIDEVDYQNFLEGYEAYHELGGNGVVTKMYNELSKKQISQ